MGHEFVLGLSMLPGCYRSGGALEYVRAGKPIPELLLPGRLLMKLPESTRRRLAETDWSNVAPWWVKVMCG